MEGSMSVSFKNHTRGWTVGLLKENLNAFLKKNKKKNLSGPDFDWLGAPLFSMFAMTAQKWDVKATFKNTAEKKDPSSLQPAALQLALQAPFLPGCVFLPCGWVSLLTHFFTQLATERQSTHVQVVINTSRRSIRIKCLNVVKWDETGWPNYAESSSDNEQGEPTISFGTFISWVDNSSETWAANSESLRSLFTATVQNYGGRMQSRTQALHMRTPSVELRERTVGLAMCKII